MRVCPKRQARFSRIILPEVRKMKPAWHYRPERNWINDPNGLVQLNG